METKNKNSPSHIKIKPCDAGHLEGPWIIPGVTLELPDSTARFSDDRTVHSDAADTMAGLPSIRPLFFLLNKSWVR